MIPANQLAIANTDYGTMLVLKNDRPRGWSLLTTRRSDDHAEIELLRSTLASHPNPMAIDVGANMGSFALALASTGATVYAFEPQSILRNILHANAVLNGHDSRIHTFGMAVGNPKTRSEIIRVPVFDYRLSGDFGCVELGETTDGPQVGLTPSGFESVPLVGLDSFFKPGTNNYFMLGVERPLAAIKIDVEGMEMDVLLGAESSIRHDMPTILVEWHKSDRRAMESLLDSWGYAIVPRGRDLFCQPRKA